MHARVNLAAKLATITDQSAPRTVAEFNGHDVMVAKLEGPFIWHQHDDTNDYFLELEVTLDIEPGDRSVTLGSGELFVVPNGV